MKLKYEDFVQAGQAFPNADDVVMVNEFSMQKGILSILLLDQVIVNGLIPNSFEEVNEKYDFPVFEDENNWKVAINPKFVIGIRDVEGHAVIQYPVYVGGSGSSCITVKESADYAKSVLNAERYPASCVL